MKELTGLLSRGGFRLTKWISNDREVLESIPQSERAASVVDLALDEIPVERTLGIHWNVGADKFCFKFVAKEKPLTRRGVLSFASSPYDPLGFPFNLLPNMILQELCKKKLGWDERIDGEELKRWKDWLADLPRLLEIVVSGCFKTLGFGDFVRVQLHHFFDASRGAYGTASYLRLVDVHGNMHCSFIIRKSRLAPLRSITIPRLELSVAVMSVKMDHMLQRELDLPLVEGIFWCDSTSVIQLIRNMSKRFHTNHSESSLGYP